MSANKHYKDWPNAAAFNALGDQRQKIKLNVTGTFPDYAAGALYRTGPGGYKIPRAKSTDGDFAVSHWFDGFVTTHRFELQRGQDGQCSEVWYNSYCQVDEAIETARKTGRLDGILFAQKRDPCDTLYKKLKTVFEPQFEPRPASANVGVTFRELMPSELPPLGSKKPDDSDTDSGYGGDDQLSAASSPRKVMLLTTDSVSGKTFDADTLEPLGVTKQTILHPALKGQLSGAHASRDARTGELFNYNLELGLKVVYRVWSANPSTGKVKILAEISDPSLKAAYIHSSMLTENYVILCVWCSFLKPLGILWNRNIMDSMGAFDKDSKATWLVIDRHGAGVVKKFSSPAFFSFHTTNAWEEEKNADGTVDITCELVEFDNLDILHRFYYENMLSNGSNVSAYNQKSHKGHRERLARYRLAGIRTSGSHQAKYSDVPSGQAEQILCIQSPDAGDLQQCNPHYQFKAHRYSWGVRNAGESSFVDSIVKTDTATKTALWWGCPKHTPGEPIFVPAPHAGAAEDEGVVLTVVFDGESGTSYLLCLDAAKMLELGRAQVGAPVGFGFHGTHVPAEPVAI